VYSSTRLLCDLQRCKPHRTLNGFAFALLPWVNHLNHSLTLAHVTTEKPEWGRATKR
jgi:hypothetical protein